MPPTSRMYSVERGLLEGWQSWLFVEGLLEAGRIRTPTSSYSGQAQGRVLPFVSAGDRVGSLHFQGVLHLEFPLNNCSGRHRLSWVDNLMPHHHSPNPSSSLSAAHGNRMTSYNAL